MDAPVSHKLLLNLPVRIMIHLPKHCLWAVFLLLLHSLNAQAQVFDADNDGVPDTVDRCPLSTDLAGPVPTETLCEGCLGDAQTVEGCNASDIISCRPGPNSQDVKYGVKPANVEKYLARRAWAGKCPIIEPPPPPEEVLGAASDTDPLTLELAGGRLDVPAAALPEGTEIRLGVSPADALEPGVIADNEVAVSPVYHLTFPDALVPFSNLALRVNVPTDLPPGIYVRMRVEGGALSEGIDDSGWMPVIGTYDPTAGTYTLPLAAAAPAISLVVLQQPDFVPQPEGSAFGNNALARRETPMQGLLSAGTWSDFFSALLGINRAEAIAAPPRTNLGDHGWAIICKPDDFDPAAPNPCDPAQLELTIGFLQVSGIAMHEAASTLRTNGFNEAALATVTLAELRQAPVVYAFWDPDGASAANNTYFLVSVTDLLKDYPGIAGWYEFATQVMLLDYRGNSPNVPIHELFHGVQKASRPDWMKIPWLSESTASAVQTLSATEPVKGKDFRHEGVWRNWELPLNDNGTPTATADWQRIAPYTVAEFWLSADPDLSQLDELITGVVPDNGTDYAAVSAQMQSAGMPAMDEAFSTVIRERAQAGGYPHCGQLIDAGNPSGPRTLVDPVECTETRCSLGDYLPLDLQPLAALCYRPLVSFADPLTCEAGETYSLSFEGETGRHEYYVDATPRLPGEEVASAPLAFELWALNRGITDNDPAEDPPAVVIEKKCNTIEEPTVIFVRQDLTTTSDAAVTGFSTPTILDSPINERRGKRYTSFEDESQLSFIQTTYRRNAVFEQDATVFVPPLGSNTWSESTNARAEWQGTETGPFYFTDASSSISSQASISPSITTVSGTMETMAEAWNERSLSDGAQGSANAIYRYRTKDEPARLDVTWDCGLALVSVVVTSIDNSTSPINETFDKQYPEFYPWECGEHNWNVPADHDVTVRLRSYWNAGRYKNGTTWDGNVQAEGGSYSIELQTVAP